MMKSYDLIIVGAGPAGSTLARLAGTERSVLLLDGQSGRIGRELIIDLNRPRDRTDREFHRSCALLQGWLRP